MSDKKRLQTTLREMPAFSACSADEIAALSKSGDITSVPAGWTLMSQSTPGDTCYVILTGAAEVVRDDETLATLGPGAVVGEAAVSTGRLRNASVISREPLELLHIDSPQFTRLVDKHPGLREALLKEH